MSKREDSLLRLCGQPMQCTGKVLAVDSGDTQRCTVRTAQGLLGARQAASCLLAPQAGDHVWLSGDLTEGLYVTAILERDTAMPARVCLPPGSSLEVAGGAFTLQADSLQLVSRKLAVQAESAALSAQQFTGIGREATWSFGSIKVIGDLLESFADRVVQFSRWSQRTVDGMDQVRSKQIDYRADQSMQLQAENLIANAGNLVKLDGEQIHLG